MKKKWFSFLALITGLLIGWAFGFLRIPYVNQHSSLLVGIVTGLVCVLSTLLLLSAWNNHRVIRKWLKTDTHSSAQNNTRQFSVLRLLISAVVLSCIGVGCVLLFRQNEKLKAQAHQQERKILQQSSLILQTRNNNLSLLMSNLLENVDEELAAHPQKSLTSETIARIVALSHSLEAYHYWNGDSLSKAELSPERAQLLQTFVRMPIDTVSMREILSRTSFAHADLKGVDLHGLDLRDINLNHADLRDADLHDVDFRYATLREANLAGANLNGARLNYTDMTRASLEWAEVNNADMDSAQLEGANFANAKLRNTRLRGAFMEWGSLNGAILQNADLSGANVGWADMSRANLFQANLYEAILLKTKFIESDLRQTNLMRATVLDTNWMEILEDWRVIGLAEIQTNFQLINDTTAEFKLRIVKRE